MCFTLFWADAVGVKEVFDCVRKSFLTLSFVCVTVYLLSANNKFLPEVFKWSCLFSGLMAIFWILLFYYIDGKGGRIGTLGGRNAPTQAGNVYALMTVITCLFFCYRSSFLSCKFFLYCCVGLSLLAFVFLTGSRGPLLSFLGILFFCSILLDVKKTLVISCWFSLLVWIGLLFKIFDFSSLLERGSSFRFTIWRQSIDLFLEKPIFGYGYTGASHNFFFGGYPDCSASS
jgi:O-antigen ligase